MKVSQLKLSLFVAIAAMTVSCNSNKSTGNNTTEAGTEQRDDPNSGVENSTPSPIVTKDSTGVDVSGSQNNNSATGSDTLSNTNKNNSK